jgi:predicted nucleic acid-binding protein
MNVYFDTSCFGRPFDDPSISRNDDEGKAILTMLEMVERGELSLTISDVVLDEIGETPDEVRLQQLLDAAGLANDVASLSKRIRERGTELERRGFKPFDALHIAAAEAARVDYLCTADDRLRKRASKLPEIKVRVVSVSELLEELRRD